MAHYTITANCLFDTNEYQKWERIAYDAYDRDLESVPVYVFPANQDRIVFPIYKNAHWFLGIIKQTNEKSKIYILDSLYVPSNNAREKDHNKVREVFQTCLRKHGFHRSVELVTVETQVQTNSVDCGAFMLFFIESFLADPSTCMVQFDLGVFRNKCNSQDFRSQIRQKLSHWIQKYFQDELGLNQDWESIVKENGYSVDESLYEVSARLRVDMESWPVVPLNTIGVPTTTNPMRQEDTEDPKGPPLFTSPSRARPPRAGTPKSVISISSGGEDGGSEWGRQKKRKIPSLLTSLSRASPPLARTVISISSGSEDGWGELGGIGMEKARKRQKNTLGHPGDKG